MWVDAELTLKVVDRQFELLQQASGLRRLKLLPHLIDFLEREPVTNAVLRDLICEANGILSTFADKCAEARKHLLKIWLDHQTEIRSLKTEEDTELDVHAKLDTYEQNLRKPPFIQTLPSLVAGGTILDESTVEFAEAMSYWAAWARHASPDEPWVRQLSKRAEKVKQEVQHAVRDLQLAAASHGGFSLLHLQRIVRQMHPNSDDELTLAIHRNYRDSVFSRTSKAVPPDVQEHIEETAEHAALLRDAVQQRVLCGLSRWTTVARFAARCESFSRDRLRRIATTGPAERALTLEFARYLFDSGLTPILDPDIGGLKPDVINAASSSLFYAEAKQYEGAHPKTTIVRAYRQVWSTWMRMAKQYRLKEGFLVVFRRDGPLVDLPTRLVFGERCLYSVLVDLADNSGSREKLLPITLNQDELLPRSVSDVTDA